MPCDAAAALRGKQTSEGGTPPAADETTTVIPSAGATEPSRAGRIERYEALVVGAGQAGLSAAYHLARRDVEFLVLDGGARVGDSWRNRWDSLRLFTPARYSGLPGMPFPAPPSHLPDKDEVADYLERYAERFELPVRCGARVERVTRVGGRFVVQTEGRRFEADTVIVATGAFQRPVVPVFARELDPRIRQLHSSAYVNPWHLPEGDALVVGAANSGAQIALELSRTRRVTLAGRDTGRLPRRLLGRDLFDWMWPIMRRVTVDTGIGRRIRGRGAGGDPLVGMTRRQLIAAGIARAGRVTGALDGRPVVDGRAREYTAIVWCTGFRPDFSWIELPIVDAAGHPRHRRGVSLDESGLYFLGLRFLHSMTSSLIGGVGADAEYVADHVARRLAAR